MIYFIICVVIFVLMALLIVSLIFLIISLIEWGNVKDGATKIPFKTFVKFYNIAPDRWVLKDGYVQKLFKKKDELFRFSYTYDTKEDFCFSYIDYIKYIIWHRQIQKEEERKIENKIMAHLIEEVKRDLDDFNEKGWK